MPGISALELYFARLYAGDTIEYYSMAFVSDDPRGYHTAVVLRVHEDVAADYPITVDMEELLPRDLMVRLLIDRFGDRFKPAYAIWRKQHSYTLVPGEFSAPTRSSSFCTAISGAVTDAFASIMLQLRGPPEETAGDGSESEHKLH
ncbi:hypothetical protein F442_04906 [Phytophthora nicotianae P10297]|uniref:Uncharacterized protein n=1 Tax=Phytophthora nicotianae P10297 TaxID=1317064 RepID=W2ZRG4_PHYNI|nr:hypothetical protein F442_04906 [Phytophthora nicotianae P10297]